MTTFNRLTRRLDRALAHCHMEDIVAVLGWGVVLGCVGYFLEGLK